MVCKKVSHSLNLLRRLSWFLPQPFLLLFLKSYIIPNFDYCDVVWFGCTKSEPHRLESLLNLACRTVLHRCKHSSASAARHDLGLSTLSSRRKLHLSSLSSSASLPIVRPTYLSSSLVQTPLITLGRTLLVNSTSRSQGHLLVKGHSVLLAPLCGDHSLRTSARRKISRLSLSSAEISSWTDLYLHAHDLFSLVSLSPTACVHV